MKKHYLILLTALATFKGFSQTPATPAPAATPAPVAPAKPATPATDFSISWYGFVRTDYIWDTRKSVNVREDHLNLYPTDVSLDANGKDRNAASQSNFLSVTTRLGVKLKGPDVWGAKMSGNLEGDFFGNFEPTAAAPTTTIGLLRLRHAYATMDWAKTSLTLGQTWYPTFIPEVFPGVANFSTGILFNPFGFASQVKLKQALSKDFSWIVAAYKEREFSTAGSVNNEASVNSVLPVLNTQLQYKNKNWFLGAGFEYKSLQPRTELSSTAAIVLPATTGVTTVVTTTEKLNSTTLYGYGKYSNDHIIIKAYAIKGGNLSDLVMLGGYTSAITNPGTKTAAISYSPTKTTAFWLDIASAGKSVAPGLFFGFTKNNGADTAGTTVGRGIGARTVNNVWRVSGRVDFKKNKFRITPELELTNAQWGAGNTFGKTTGALTTVNNFRTMVSCAYSF